MGILELYRYGRLEMLVHGCPHVVVLNVSYLIVSATLLSWSRSHLCYLPHVIAQRSYQFIELIFELFECLH